MTTTDASKNNILPLAIVTGAARGIGRAAAELLAHQKGFNIVLVIRDIELGKDVENEIRKIWSHVHSIPCSDLGSHAEVQKLKKVVQEEKFPKSPLKVLVNCAAECPKNQVLRKRLRKPMNGPSSTVEAKASEVSEELVDAQFSSNVLAYHFMIKEFVKNQIICDNTYIVNVASNWAGDVDLDDFNFSRRTYDNDSAYRQSKACDRMLTKEWSDHFKEQQGKQNKLEAQYNIFVNSCHPGDPCTKLSTALGYNLYASKDCRSSCKSIMYLATKVDTSGGWYEADGSKQHCGYMSDRYKQERKKLWEICESFCVSDS